MMENINLIRKIAWSFHRTTGHDWDDLFQEAALCYLEKQEKYGPEKGYYLSTFMWNAITARLRSYLKRYHRKNGHVCSLEDHPSDVVMFHNPLFERLTKTGEEILDVILDNSEEFDVLESKFCLPALTRKLRAMGWSWAKIQAGFRDLRQALS